MPKEYLQNRNLKKRNVGFDFLKFLCAFMVVFIHSDYSGKEFLDPYMRIAVPIFFMISGFFYSGICKNNRQLLQIKRFVLLIIISNILYLAKELIINISKNRSLSEILNSVFNVRDFIKFLLFNQSPYNGHLWYLGAALYVLIIVFISDRYFSRKKLYYLIPFLLIINLILGNYSTFIFDKTIPFIVSRNFLFVGLPFFLIGDFLYNNISKININNLIALLILFSTFITIIIEKSFLINYNSYNNRELYLSTIPMSLIIFYLVIKNKGVFEKRIFKGFAFIGKELSLIVYIIHPLVLIVLSKLNVFLLEKFEILNIYNCIEPLFVMLFSVTFAFVWLQVQHKLKIHCNKS